MTECPCDLEKTVDPQCCAAGMCARDVEEMETTEAQVNGPIEHRDHVLGATTKEMGREFAAKIHRLERTIPVLKNQDGGYAHDLRDCLEMYREIAGVIAKYRAMKRPAP